MGDLQLAVSIQNHQRESFRKDDTICITGFKIKNGRINLKNSYLEEEAIREFENALPAFNIKVVQKKSLSHLNVRNDIFCLF